MKKIKIISLRIMALFTVAIFVSFIPEYLNEFFGDWKCEGRQYVQPIVEGSFGSYQGCNYGGDTHSPVNHWGYRHWLFFAMGMILFFIQVFDIINYAAEEQVVLK